MTIVGSVEEKHRLKVELVLQKGIDSEQVKRPHSCN